MKNVLKSLAKSVLTLLWLTASASATVADIYKKMFESGRRLSKLASRTKTLMISNKEMNDIMKIVSILMNLVY